MRRNVGIKPRVRGKHTPRNNNQPENTLNAVSKKSTKSLGIEAIDAMGLVRLSGNRFMKVYEVTDGNVSQLVGRVCDLLGRIRITIHSSEYGGRASCHITLMETGDAFLDVLAKFDKDEEVLGQILNIRQLETDEIMSQIALNYLKEVQFSYASGMYGKVDLKKECFVKVKENSTAFLLEEKYGECFVIKAFPDMVESDLSNTLKRIGCEFYLSADISALSMYEHIDFNRELEKRYNRRISANVDKDYINLSVMLVTLCDSDDARKIVEETVIGLTSKENLMCVPAYYIQEKLLESILSFGLVDEKLMRNANMDMAKKLLGGEINEDTKN